MSAAMRENLRAIIPDCLLVWGMNLSVFATITLSQIKDIVAIALGIVTIISTLVITRNNLRKRDDSNPRR